MISDLWEAKGFAEFMRMTLISTEGPWLEAKVKTADRILTVMDEFSIDHRSTPVVGGEFDAELSASVEEDRPWDEMFSGNPLRQRDIQQIEGWQYRALGEVTSINPVTVDCGLLSISEVFHSNDARVVGEFIAFTISQLAAIQHTEQRD